MVLSPRLTFLPITLLAFLLITPFAASEDVTLPNGLRKQDTKTVKCNRPARSGDTISVHYAGHLENGLQFDESWDKGRPLTFTLGAGEVIPGWDQGLLGMCIGTRRRLTIPPELGYGATGSDPIPPNAVLIFDTQLMGIAGVPRPPPDEEVAGGGEEPTEPVDEDDGDFDGQRGDVEAVGGSQGHPGGPGKEREENTGECHLLGPFAIIVQGALGILALASLVFKRWREVPRRPLLIWFFDVSKQVVGTALLHVANLAMSMLGSGSLHKQLLKAATKGKGDRLPNPCSFYLLNLGIDTTVGIPILVVLLRVLHALFTRTPLGNPPESLKTGYYGQPPRVGWWIKQSFIYFLGLFGMKLFVLFLFAALPWLPWVGDWALRWTEGNESLQIAFVMFIFPLAMNALQYYIIDSFIKDDAGQQGYESVDSDERDVDVATEPPTPFAEGDDPDEVDKIHVNGRTNSASPSDDDDGGPLHKRKPGDSR